MATKKEYEKITDRLLDELNLLKKRRNMNINQEAEKIFKELSERGLTIEDIEKRANLLPGTVSIVTATAFSPNEETMECIWKLYDDTATPAKLRLVKEELNNKIDEIFQ